MNAHAPDGVADEFAASQPGSCGSEGCGELRAAIDVGTNSVKLLVGRVDAARVHPVSEESKQTRLGAGFYETRRLQPGPIEATARAVAGFADKARRMGAKTIRLIGTSAARDALNAADLTGAILRASGLSLEVISGEQEADWAFRGVLTDPRLADLPLLILDAGGGSSEFIVGENSRQSFSRSYKLGTVRLLESLKLGDPPGLDALEECRRQVNAFIAEKIFPDVAPHLRACRQKPSLVGVGGTATILAKIQLEMQDFDRERIEKAVAPLERVKEWAQWMWQCPLARRAQLPGLPPKRADVILCGVAIYQSIMEQFGFPELRVSARGIRYTALLEPRRS
jgi:exopolyphosphatase / guanosine-5'-triphosphate,3'-diphosphate pyrophosphatase